MGLYKVLFPEILKLGMFRKLLITIECDYLCRVKGLFNV